MSEQNIWENLDLSDDKLKTVYDYLVPQTENFNKATKGELTMEIEVLRTVAIGEKKRRMTLYTLFVIAPNLGNFRKKIFHAAEFDDIGRFPVNLYCHTDASIKKDVTEADFLNSVKEILSRSSVTGAIESLYRQSKVEKNNS